MKGFGKALRAKLQYRHPTKPGRVTIDAGAREIPTGTLRSIYRQARWEW
jgi:predicted RNA binding protein YcfA (HicA-like mRNA interferase family)